MELFAQAQHLITILTRAARMTYKGPLTRLACVHSLREEGEGRQLGPHLRSQPLPPPVSPNPVEAILPQLQMGFAGRSFYRRWKVNCNRERVHTAVDVTITLEPDFSVIQLSRGYPSQISLLLQQVECGWNYYFELLTGVRHQFMSLQ